MILSGFGISLRRITRSDIELIRTWRNQDFVRDQMFERELITEVQQVAWFDIVNNPFNYYFIIEVNEKPIGVIYAKNVNPESMVGEGGIFIGEQPFLTTDLPGRASILLLYFCFNKLSLSSSLIRVKKGNDVALAYNQTLGYSIQSQHGNEIILSLTKEAFEASAVVSRLMRHLKQDSICLTGIPSDNNLSRINELLSVKR
jgi:RimJ/RimL family protein N-acetyltransferase